jgi:hypothetical protein
LRTRALVALAALCAAWIPSSALARIITVTTLQEEGPPAECELDEAILNAIEDHDQGLFGCDRGQGADTIVFDIDPDDLPGAIELSQPLPELEGTITIQGPGADQLAISGEDLVRVMSIAPDATIEISGVTILDGGAPAGSGGALFVGQDATLVLRDCRIAGSGAFNGGALFVDRAAVRIERCVLDGNTTTGGSGAAIGILDGTLDIVNSTITDNEAVAGGGGSGAGGGLAVAGDDGSLVRIASSTISHNGAATGGNLWIAGGSDVELQHTILAAQISGGNCDGGVTSLGFNLESGDGCGLDDPTDIQDTGAGLANNLADNGGPTPTRALQADSAAVDAGDFDCFDPDGLPLATDQRGDGFPRGTDGDLDGSFRCDIGAFERAPEPAAGGAAAALVLGLLARARRPRVP